MKIYKLEHEDGRFYIGSTQSDLNVRFQKHKANKLVIEFNDCWDKVKIILVEEVVCDNRKELQKKEQEYIDTLKNENCLNKIRACRKSRHDEYIETYSKIKGTDKDWYSKHREKNREKNREYAKQYATSNAELLKQKRKEYYEKNKETILNKAREKYLNNKSNASI
jgi:hypothetical protein